MAKNERIAVLEQQNEDLEKRLEAVEKKVKHNAATLAVVVLGLILLFAIDLVVGGLTK